MPTKSAKKRVYASLMADLEERIRGGLLPPGSQVPSEAQLCQSYAISRISVRRALAELEDQGLVCRRAGKGTFVQFPGVNGRTPTLAPIGISGPHSPSARSGYPYLGSIREAIAERAFAMGYRVEWVDPRRLGELDKDALSGVICVSWRDEDEGDLGQLAKRGVPVVAVNRRPKSGLVNAVTIDHRNGARKAVEYLMHLGHREIAFASGAWETFYVRERLAGYQDALEAGGIAADADLAMRLDEGSPDSIWNRIAGFFSARKPTAVFVAAGGYAAPVLAALSRLGHAIPKDISVIVFDDVPNPLYPIVPELTVVRQPLQEIGHRCVSLLDRIRRNGLGEGIVETLSAELVVRESCRAIP